MVPAAHYNNMCLFDVVGENGPPGGRGMINLLSLWWVGLGIAVYFMFNRPDNLLTDSLKGAILLFLNYTYFTEKRRGLHNDGINGNTNRTRIFFLGL